MMTFERVCVKLKLKECNKSRRLKRLKVKESKSKEAKSQKSEAKCESERVTRVGRPEAKRTKRRESELCWCIEEKMLWMRRREEKRVHEILKQIYMSKIQGFQGCTQVFGYAASLACLLC